MSFEKVDSTSNRLKVALERAGMKQTDLALKTGIDKGSISHYLSGKYEPKQTALYRIGKVLDVSEMWLAGYDIPMERPAEQKENDKLADLVDRLKKENDFRQLILKINCLKSEQLEVIKSIIDAFLK